MKLLFKLLLILLSLALIALLGFGIYYFAVTASAHLDGSTLHLAQNSLSLYDTDGNLLVECSFRGENGVKTADLQPHTIDAFVCAEDREFFTHKGLNYKRMAKAAWRNLTALSFKEGASTISQQLIKNTQLTPEKTLNRKLKEIKLTKMLEKRYTKDEILEMYLNTIYFGHSAFGLESAAKFYFDCSAEELSLAQSAILAGMIKSPNNYSPFKNSENCVKRRDFILKVMENEGYITAEDRLLAQKEVLPTAPHEVDGFAKCYYHNVFSEVEDIVGADVYGGLKIYTYLDCGLQKELEKQAENCPTDKSFCVIDNATCGVKAFYSTIGNAKRLPASAIKPLLVYAPALQENIISPATPVLDEKIDYAGYSPQNYGGEYHGYVSAREALAKSYNVPTVKILNALNVKKGAEYLKKMNLSVKNEDLSLALALGGMREGFALKDLVGAYTTFANQGNFTPCAFIEKITDSKGNLLFERSKKSKKVFDFDSVTLLNDMLQTAVQSGTAKKLSGLPYEVCAKTGTGANANGNTDAYCVAYTSADTIGVWLGNADGSSIENITGGGLPANINLNVQKYLYQNTSPAEFKKSDGVIRCSLDKLEYEKNHALFLSDVNAPIQEKTFSELFKKNFAPKKSSTYFSRPKLQNVGISCQNDGILLQLCHAEYLTIIINRAENGEFKTIYQGECVENWLDEDVEEGKTYEYSITPYYKEFVGDTMVLPKVQYKKKSSADAVDKAPLDSIIPREWWR